jgi:hypothetical protein
MGDETFHGSWRESNGVVHVESAYGSRSAPIGGARANPKVLATMMFKQVLRAHKP